VPSIALWTKSQNLSTEGLILRVLTFTKKIVHQAPSWDEAFDIANAEVPDHKIWEELLQKHVSPDGKVDYIGLEKDKTLFSSYLEELSSHPPNSRWGYDDKLAYWINAYNAFTVQLILDHMPIQSIKEIAGNVPMINSAWDLKFFKIGGIDFDLNMIEHEILRKEFNEPRIHFVINCASQSCPILSNYAYTGVELNNQITRQSQLFLNDSSKNKISPNDILLSPIFKWYSDDFGSRIDLLDLLESISGIPIDGKVPISYMDYDWSLND
jgi:hypothetical protein